MLNNLFCAFDMLCISLYSILFPLLLFFCICCTNFCSHFVVVAAVDVVAHLAWRQNAQQRQTSFTRLLCFVFSPALSLSLYCILLKIQYKCKMIKGLNTFYIAFPSGLSAFAVRGSTCLMQITNYIQQQ